MLGKLLNRNKSAGSKLISFLIQALSALQDAPESYEAAIALPTTTRASHTPQTFFREGTLHGQDRDVRRVPAEGPGLDELYAVAPPSGRKRCTATIYGRPEVPTPTVPV